MYSNTPTNTSMSHSSSPLLHHHDAADSSDTASTAGSIASSSLSSDSGASTPLNISQDPHVKPPSKIAPSSSFYDSAVNKILLNGYLKRLYKSNNRYHRFHAILFRPQKSLLEVETNRGSPFFGFYTLFWMIVALLIIQSVAYNYANTRTFLGFNIINTLRKDLFKVAFTDLVMYLATYFGVFLQLVIKRGWLSWKTSGWILQNIYQTLFLFTFMIIPEVFNFPWIARVFILLHSLVFLMKQHSFAFSNGYLWEIKNQVDLIDKVLTYHNVPIPTGEGYRGALNIQKSDIEDWIVDIAKSISQEDKVSLIQFREFLAVELVSTKPYKSDKEHSHLETKLANGHTLTEELATSTSIKTNKSEAKSRLEVSHPSSSTTDHTVKDSATPTVFPQNISLSSYFMFSMFPTLVYRFQYPRTRQIRWFYVLEKTIATFGVFLLMIIVAENHLYPIAMEAIALRETPLLEKMTTYPLILARLTPPFVLMFLLVFYIIWDAILNGIAELTRYADRNFYGPWWNCVTWDQFARDWNTPVHLFLLQHVYHSTILAFNMSKKTATVLTFLLSSCIHELVMFVIFKKFRGYLLALQMCQLPLVALSRTRYLRDKRVLGNVIFWMGIFTGPSLMCSLYLTF